MSTPAGHRPEHNTERAVYPKVTPRRSTVAMRKPSTKGSGMKPRRTPREHR